MRISHSQPNLAIQINLFDEKSQSASTGFSATHSPISATTLDQEARYLCAWLRSRLEDGTWTLRDESALTATQQQRRQVTRLAQKARALGLAVWPQRKVVAA